MWCVSTLFYQCNYYIRNVCVYAYFSKNFSKFIYMCLLTHYKYFIYFYFFFQNSILFHIIRNREKDLHFPRYSTVFQWTISCHKLDLADLCQWNSSLYSSGKAEWLSKWLFKNCESRHKHMASLFTCSM